MFSREKWLDEDCVFTGMHNCVYCPYAVYTKDGLCKCEKEMYEKCVVEGEEAQ